MKTLYQMRRETGVNKDYILSVIRKEGIKWTKIGGINFYTEEQTEIIYRVLYFESKCDTIILESIIN